MKVYLRSIPLALFAAGVSLAAAFSEPLQAGVEAAFPPWSYVENGQFKGIAIDAVREIAKQRDSRSSSRIFHGRRSFRHWEPTS